ncbi:alpha-L-fucosidase [Sphingobacterium paludis]|uniref:alpha-L-fucosidase n=1 Tax=Sphingobacterium paludis TaxID=1476465 RepID=A0A4R7CSP8_9SPHI|nr:alpha-L-fucosidase [Sphingobacterium paludis]TDS06803.1 alpha-L-fucosidase [Sphingobacterium paludis]
MGIKIKYLGLLALLVFIMSASRCAAQQFERNWGSLDARPIPAWWSEAKFGIFVHWGLYSVPAYAPVDEVDGVYEKYAEHYLMRLMEKNKLFTAYHTQRYGEGASYANFALMFRAQSFEPEKWADLFKSSGAGYVVLTSKHHDGFCLWPSAQSNGWNSKDLGPKRDIIGDLSAAVRNTGLRFGLYYSLLEWTNPLYSAGDMDAWASGHMIPQMKDLVERYRPEVFFADGEWDYTSEQLKSTTFLQWLYNESSVKNTIVINDRWGKETRSKHGGYYTTEYDLIGDTLTSGSIEHPWEESRGIGTSYGYNKFETTAHYFSGKQLIDLLIEKVSGGGNLLLNVGPDADGLIPVVMQERLLAIGQWLAVNGEAIYGTTAWHERPKQQDRGIYFTKKGGDIYVICTKWPQGEISVPGLGKRVKKVQMLGTDIPVRFKVGKGQLRITPPAINPATAPCVHAWAFKLTLAP